MAVMSKDEREAFFREPRVGVIAIAEADRGPLAVPIWYSYGDDGVVRVLMSPNSKKAKLIEAAGRFSICTQSEQLPYRYVMAEGPVVDTRDVDIEEHARPMARRYLGETMGDDYVESGQDSSSIVISMKPERWYSTDYGKVVETDG